MATSYSAVNKFPVPAAGDAGWSTPINTFLNIVLDEAISGYSTHTVTTDETLTISDNAASTIRNPFIKLTGTPGAARTITVPTVEKWWVVDNATSDGYAHTIKTASGAGVSVPNGKKMFLHCDGTNVIEAITYSANLAPLASPTFTGTATFAALTTTGNVTIGDNSSDTLTVNATPTFAAATTFNGALTVGGAAVFNGNVDLGNAAGDVITITGTPTFAQTVTMSGNASVGGALTVTGATTLNGAVTLGDAAGDVITVNGNATFANNLTVTGTLTASGTFNAATATALANSRTFSITGDGTAGPSSFNGTANVSMAFTLANSGVSASTYGSSTAIPVLTVDAKGRITSATTASITQPFTESFESAEISITSSGVGTVAHGLSGRPKLIQMIYRCKTADANFSVDDEIYVSSNTFVGSGAGVSVNATCSSSGSTHIRYTYANSSYLQVTNATTGAVDAIGGTLSRWRLVIRAWY